MSSFKKPRQSRRGFLFGPVWRTRPPDAQHPPRYDFPAVPNELLDYLQQIRLRGNLRQREWYWPKNADRPKWLAYTLEYEPFTLLLKVFQYVRRRRALAPFTLSQRPTGERVASEQLEISIVAGQRGAFEIQMPVDPATGSRAPLDHRTLSGPLSLRERVRVRVIECGETRPSALNHAHPTPLPEGEGTRSTFPLEDGPREPVEAVRLSSGHRRLILAHVYFEDEAERIFDKLQPFTDYDQVVTSSVPALRDAFLKAADPNRAACFLVPNTGRDVLPFLLAIHALDLSGYDQFIKIHTKRSAHLVYGQDWFGTNLDTFIGNKIMTDCLLDRIDPSKPSLYGVKTLPLRDHFPNNRHWLRHLTGLTTGRPGGRFIPGTMFAGSGHFLRELAALDLHLNRLEPETGQLDGTYVHALERFFGYFAQSRGGECVTVESLVSSHQRRATNNPGATPEEASPATR